MIITICGLAGTGTSTTGRLLAEKLDYEFISTGDIFREKAKELGMSLNDFEELCRSDENYDKSLDKRIEEIGKTKDNIVIESRLAWYFIPHSLKIKFTCNDDVRIARVASRERSSFSEAKEKTQHREQLIRQRFRNYYNIDDFDNDSHFDVVISTSTDGPAELVEEIIKITESSS